MTKTQNFPPELESLLLASIEEDWQAAVTAYEQSDLKHFAYYIHRLHGALCYCNTPSAKNLIGQLENLLNTEHPDLNAVNTIYSQLKNEINLLLKK